MNNKETQSYQQRGMGGKIMDTASGHVNLWLIVLLSATAAEKLRGLVVMAIPEATGRPARRADTPDQIFKQPACATEPLPFLYQG